MPPILQISADNAISICKSNHEVPLQVPLQVLTRIDKVLAAYLTQYAKGVDNAVEA
jgi:hypothetical protein